ncbi:MAG: ATP-dependent helicase HrpB [Acidobacteriaceae bacterium]|nr:ATP-dependent helicase HrpB [Acidobacteriaceae bacterium]
MSRKPALPIDALLPEIIASLQHHPSLIVEAQPGAGKTTRVPPALLDVVTGEIVVLEPRRIAARMAARRVAWELGESVGETAGYQVRFEEVGGPKTRLRFVTEGVLTRRLLTDPTLRGVDAIVLDEFHERHIDSDFALALLKQLQHSRPDLRIVIMSATLDAAPIARYLDDCPVLRSEGRLFDLSIKHLLYSPEPLYTQVRNAVDLLMREGHQGDTLVFLPGAAEIRRAIRECDDLARRKQLLMLPLHGDLSPTEQDRAVEPSQQQKLILATNVAESSITVEGVTAVIDSGFARVASHSPWTGLPTLEISRISQASARQRAGRAGRTAPGRVVRLYPEEDFLRRPEHDTPEIVRSDLSQLGIALRAMGLTDFAALDWLDVPPPAAVQQAELLLDRLGATGLMARQLARYPLPPRLSRILVEATARGVGEDACIAVALLGSGARSENNDILAAMEAPQDPRTTQHIQQLRRIARPPRQTVHDDDALLLSILAGFPDRVGRRRSGNQITLATGTSAEVSGDPPQYEFMVAVDAEDRKDKPIPMIRMTARIEPDWLIDLFPDRVREQSGVVWNRIAERVDAISALLYDELTIQETRDAIPDPNSAAELLAEKALETGVDRFIEREELNNFLARLDFANFEAPDIPATLRKLCIGLRSFAELKRAVESFIPLLEQELDSQRLRRDAPVTLRLQGGRQAKVHYERGKIPWIASRLQDFFGMRDTPRIGPNQTPVVVHLLAPNQRAVQTTTDLAGFWERLYPQVRRELMRRYPRHAWPEKP